MEKEKSLAPGKAEDVLSQDEKKSGGSFKDYLVRNAPPCALKNTADEVVPEDIPLR